MNDPDWIKYTKEMAEVGKAAYRASQTRNQEKVSDITGDIADACLHCHQVFRDKVQRRGRERARGLTNKSLRCTKSVNKDAAQGKAGVKPGCESQRFGRPHNCCESALSSLLCGAVPGP